MSDEKNQSKASSADSNLSFWLSVERTDPGHVKSGSINGQFRTCVDAQYKKKQITKAFGMYGRGWGVIPESEKYERIYFDNSTCLLNYTATAFYVVDGEKYHIPLAAQVKEAYITNGGKGYLKIDDEAVKKVRTDALTKAFTDLGFNSDIHMGLFDDQSYVAGVTAKAAIEKEEQMEAEITKAMEEIGMWVKEQLKAIQTIKSDESFFKAIDRVKEKLSTRCQAAGINPQRYNNRLEEIKQERTNASK